MNRKGFAQGLFFLYCANLNAMEIKRVDKKITNVKKLSGIDPHRDLTPTSPRSYKAWLAQHSPRSRQNAEEGPEADTRLNRFLYCCLCIPLFYFCCQPKQYEDV